MKKIFCLLLTLVTLFALSVPAFAAQPETAVPYYTNATRATATLSISNSGTATIGLLCIGKSGTRSIVATYYLEKKNGSSWSRVDIDEPNDQWVDSSSSSTFNKTRTIQLQSTGEYRLSVNYVVTISSSETIPLTASDSY